MQAPVNCEEIKKSQLRAERATATKETEAAVRPEVAKLIEKVVKENAPTWKELAQR